MVSADGQTNVLPSAPVDTSVDVPSGEADRVLALAELSDSGWSASGQWDDVETRTDVDGWSAGVCGWRRQRQRPHRAPEQLAPSDVLLELVVVLALVVLALPSRRSKPEELV